VEGNLHKGDSQIGHSFPFGDLKHAKLIETDGGHNMKLVSGEISMSIEMPTDKERERLAFFDLYAKNASFYDTEATGGIFICPLCHVTFVREDCIGENCNLTLAHIYPKKAGGKPTTLACRGCNNNSGMLCDKEIVWEHQLAAVAAKDPTVSLPAEMKILDETYRINFSQSDKGFAFDVVQKASANDRKAIERLKAKLQATLPHIEFNVTHQDVQAKLWHRAMVSCAHLLLFREFGYEYIGSPLGLWVRDVSLDAERAQKIPVVDLHRTDGFTDSVLYRIFMLNRPHECRSMWIALPSPRNGVAARAVVLPGDIDEGSMAAFEALQTNTPSRAVFSFDEMPAEQRLATESYKGWLARWWWNIKNERLPLLDGS
jgi:hypothetical protein